MKFGPKLKGRGPTVEFRFEVANMSGNVDKRLINIRTRYRLKPY